MARHLSTLESDVDGPKDRIIVALDVDSLKKAQRLIEELAPHVGCFKVGLELITSVGAPQVVKFVHDPYA